MPIDRLTPLLTPTGRPGAAPAPTQDGAVSPGDIAVGVVVGRASEYFDFFVYGIASVLVFPGLFFPSLPPAQGLMAAFAVLALGFVLRPLGTLLGMAVQRRHGRGPKLTIALVLLGTATCGMALLPGTGQAGTGAVLALAAFRALQGLAVGASWDGLPSLLAISAPPHRRGWYAMLGQLGAPLGFALAAALYAYLWGALSQAEFLAWGWRFPFFVAFAVNVVALFARLQLVLGDDYSQAMQRHALQPNRLRTLLRHDSAHLAAGALAGLASFALVHLVTVFPLCWLLLQGQRPLQQVLWVQVAGAGLAAASMLGSGWLADRIGRRQTLALGAVLIALFSLGAPWWLDGGASGQNLFILLGFALLGLSYGQAAGAMAGHFQPALRYLGAALSADLAWLAGAAFAPLLVLALSLQFGLGAVSGYLLSGALATLAALRVHRRLID